jgi:MEDS: MEthanogen/methylotroph, DcmR Sensory domain
MKKTTAPISLAGSQLDQTRHVCAFFNDDEEYQVLLSFIKDGFQCGHKAIHVVNPDRRQDHLQRLGAVGIDAAAQQGGQPDLRINTDVYLPDGRFDPDRMISIFEQLARGNSGRGFTTSTDDEMNEKLSASTGDSSPAPMRFFSYEAPEENSREQIKRVRHPWIAKEIPVRGFIFDVDTGVLREVQPIPEQTAA